MFDILQLNDMLVPELQDIAEQLAITNYKKLEKQDLVYKILEQQAVAGTDNGKDEKPKRKRIVKATGKPAEEAADKASAKAASKKAEPVAEKKKPVKKAEADDVEEDLQPITSEQSTIPAAIASSTAY